MCLMMSSQNQADPKENPNEHNKKKSKMAHTKSKHDQPEQTPQTINRDSDLSFQRAGHEKYLAIAWLLETFECPFGSPSPANQCGTAAPGPEGLKCP